MKKKLNDIRLEKNGWKLTPKSASALAERKDKTALSAAIVGIKRELQANNNIIADIKNKINDNFDKLKPENKMSNAKEIKEVIGIIKENNVILCASIQSISESLEKNDAKQWKFEVKRNYAGEIQEVIARQI